MNIYRPSTYPTLVLVGLSFIYFLMNIPESGRLSTFAMITMSSFGVGELVGALVQSLHAFRPRLVVPRILHGVGGVLAGLATAQDLPLLSAAGAILFAIGVTLTAKYTRSNASSMLVS